MTEALSIPRRGIGRPRVFSDATIFQGVDAVIRRDGYPELTLEQVATEVGCTRQALVRRFDSKMGLMLAYLEAMVGSVAATFANMSVTQGSPLQALRTQFTLPPDQRVGMIGNPDAQAKLLAFLLITSGEPEFAAQLGALNRLHIQAIEDLLQAAVDQEELRPIDSALLARILYDFYTGELVSWCVDRSTDLAAEFSLAFDLLIDPYRAQDAVHE